MKKILLAFAAIIISAHLFAQNPQSIGANKGKQMPAIGHIYGKVVDSADKPIGQATIILLQNKFDSSSKKMKQILYKGATTEPNGDFDFSDLPLWGITLKISALGYKPYEEKINFQMKAPSTSSSTPSSDPSKQMQQFNNAMGALDKDLGNIRLATESNQLQTVTVTATAPALKMDIDKKTFNVDKNIVSSGGTAIDVMKNVPSLQVDIDGNVKLRNATPQIYIDGRPTTLTLDQIPADAIQSVEVITNPSAKYDASGGNAGILNIILKKNKKTGYNGNVMTGVDSRGGYNFGGNFAVRQGKVNLTAAVMVNDRRSLTKGTTDQLYHYDTLGIKDVHSFQNTSTTNNGAFMFGRLGLDYFVTNRTTLSLAGIRVHGEFKPTTESDITTDSIFDDHTLTYPGTRTSYGNRTFNATGLQAGMVHNFAKDGEQLTADGNFFSGKNNGDQTYLSNLYDPNGNFVGTSTQQQLSSGTNQFLTIQSDYTNPLSKNTKLEAGVRAQINKVENDNQTYYVNGSEATKVPGTEIEYHNTNDVYAGYATITSAIKNFGYEAGLRVESSNYTGVLNDTQSFTHNYPVSLFPSVFLSYKLKNRQELQANFSRRINRPNFFQLIPYTDRSDSLHITRGNPDLKPEFTSSFEVSYSKTYGKNNSFLASLYYKYTTDLITSYQQLEYNPVLNRVENINTYENANSAYSYGAELTSVNYVTKWWDFNLNLNLYKSKINTDNLNTPPQDALLSWFAKWNNNIKLPDNFTIQLSANYQSKTNLPVNTGGQQWGPPQSAQSAAQGYIMPFWTADVAIKKTFFKNQAGAVTLSMNDIFRTGASNQISFGNNFYQDYYRLNNPQLLRLNFTYRFGKMDVSLFKRQNKNQGQGLQDASQMGGTK
jgi:outer membrane receptor protein involved in Fe transport